MRAVSRAAEGFRRAFTVSEVLRMQDAGIISDDERYELIEGEIVLMQAKGPLHETLKSALVIAAAKALPDHMWMAVEPSVYLSQDTFVDPDIILFPRAVKMENLRGEDISLVIEVAATSLAYDKGVKLALYSNFKVQEYWVVDAYQRITHQFFEPQGGMWRRENDVGPDEFLTHPLLPGFSVRLSDY